MYGGEIYSNKGSHGGGISMGTGNNSENHALFTMYGGEIYSNTATGKGGGLYIWMATFYKKPTATGVPGGIIRGNSTGTRNNTASSHGHAICVYIKKYDSGGTKQDADVLATTEVKVENYNGYTSTNPGWTANISY
jgi:hypothetical protein